MKTKITIKGRRVQDIGYRLFLLSRAHNLKGFEASNIEEDLIILIEGEEEKIKQFIQTTKSEKPPLAEVSEVIVEGYDGEVMDVKAYREQLSLEQLAKIVTVGVEIRDDIKTMLKKQDETIAEIRATRDEVRALREDLKQYMDKRFERLEKEIALIKQKIGLT